MPTSNHRPWWTAPKQRPSSIARSHRMLVENGPSGASRSNRLDTIWMPVKTKGATLLFSRRGELPVRLHVKVALPVVIARPRLRDEQQQRIHLPFAPMRREQAQRVGRPVDPEIVAVDHQEGVGADHRLGLDHSAAGLEQQARARR